MYRYRHGIHWKIVDVTTKEAPSFRQVHHSSAALTGNLFLKLENSGKRKKKRKPIKLAYVSILDR